ncbi:MAG: methyl-accepting chemotaxis protein [Candidatus Zixiibacteriota bacterium]
MKLSSLTFKIPLVCLGLLTFVFTAIVVINHMQLESSLSELNNQNSRNINWSLTREINDYMLIGENEKIQEMAQEGHELGIFSDLTVVDDAAVIRRASDAESVGSQSRDTYWLQVFKTKQDIMLDTLIDDIAYQVSYRALVNSSACTDCHDKGEGEVLGGLKIIRSEQQSAEALASNFEVNIIIAVIAVVLLIANITFVMRRKIFKPLKEVGEKLQFASVGEVNQNIKVKSQDEIGDLLSSVRNVFDYMKTLAGVSEKIADNDLTMRFEPKSERDILGQSFKQMMVNLKDIAGQLAENAGQLVSAAEQITRTSESMVDGAVMQEERSSQISAAIEQMSANIVQASTNANDARKMADEASNTAGAGQTVVGETIDGLSKIAESSGHSGQVIKELADASVQIGQITEVIEDIADQTNLLALNAAIEAARAGEQGRGFAVVADEVRKLAERTAKATGEITNMVTSIQANSGRAVSSVEEATELVEAGRARADDAGKSLIEISNISQRVNEMIAQLAAASAEQSTAVEEISKNMEGIAAISRSSADGAKEAAQAAEQLNAQATSMQQLVNRFKM